MSETIDLLLLGAGQMITSRSDGNGPLRGKNLSDAGILRDSAIAIAGGRILAIGKTDSVKKEVGQRPVSRVIELGGRVVMPGWVAPHTHAVFPRYRADEYEARIRGDSYLEIERRGGGIKRTVRELREMGEEDLYEISRRRLLKMIRTGVTTIEIKSGYGLDLENELKMLRVISRLAEDMAIDIVPTFMGAHQKPPEFAGKGEYVKFLIAEVIPEVARLGKAKYIDVFCEKDVFDLDETRQILAAGKEHGFGLKLHADEIFAIGGTELAVELGAVSVDHLTKITETGIEALSHSGTIGVLLPSTSFGLASRSFAPARKLVSSGAAIALATDFNPGSAPSFSMPLAISIACSQMGLLPSEAINASTINAAYSIGMQKEIGSLEKGKKADIVVYDVEDYREIPSRAGTDHSVIVIKEGNVIWEMQDYESRSEVGF